MFAQVEAADKAIESKNRSLYEGKILNVYKWNKKDVKRPKIFEETKREEKGEEKDFKPCIKFIFHKCKKQ